MLVTHDERLAKQCHRTIRLVAGEIISDEINTETAPQAALEEATHD